MVVLMGINFDWINMLIFGFGFGIVGIVGVVIGFYVKVILEMGVDYIV